MFCGFLAHRLADYLDTQREALRWQTTRHQRQVMKGAAQYIRFLETQRTTAQTAPPEQTAQPPARPAPLPPAPPPPAAPPATSLSKFIDQQVVDSKPGMTARRITFK
jgi:hypothetical protein